MKKVFKRAAIGAPLGLMICYFITVFVSLGIHDGAYHPVAAELGEAVGELNAVLLQTACATLYGAMWGGASVIWEQEKWSWTKMTLIHLAITSLSTFPVAFFMYWMPHTVVGIVVYFAIFFGIYLAIWLWQYLAMRKRVKELNEKIQEENEK